MAAAQMLAIQSVSDCLQPPTDVITNDHDRNESPGKILLAVADLGLVHGGEGSFQL